MRRTVLVLLVVSLVAGCSPSDPSVARLTRALGSTGMVVSQVYAGGGNSGAFLTYDYLELFNRGAVSVNLSGWSVQYAAAASSSWSVHALPAVAVQPGRYLLVQLGTASSAVGAPLPVAADSIGTINMSASNGKVALVNSTTACGSPCATSPTVVDFVGYGSASEFEGAATPSPGTNNTALLRKAVGCVDTDNNAADFDLGTWTAALTAPLRNSASTAAVCAAPDAGSADLAPPDAGVVADLPAPDAAIPAKGAVVISQIYGAGGNSGATYTHDYVELFNRGTASVPIGGWSVQYGTSANAFSQKADIPAGASIAPGRYFLIQLAGGTAGVALPAPDLTGGYNMSATGGKVALVGNTTLLPCGTAANRCVSPAIMDLVGYGGASDYEAAATTAPSTAAQAKHRRNGGCTDTDNNAADFETASAEARNSVTPTRACTTTDGRAGGDFSPSDAAPKLDLASPPLDAAIPTADLAPPSDASAPADAAAPSPGAVVISQIYGAGGNAGAKYTHDYVELFNRGTVSVAIGGWSLQYGTSASAFSQKSDIPAGTSLDPGQYFLIQLTGGSTGTALPAPDLVTSGSGSYAISASAGKLALVASTTLLPCGTAANRCSSPTIMDLVGYGGAADFEGTATPAPALATQAMFRRNGGCTDTGDNAADFELVAAEARNSATPSHDCAVKGDAGPGDGAKPLDGVKAEAGATLDAGAPSDAKTAEASPAPDAGKASDASPSDGVSPSDTTPPPSYVIVMSQIYPAGGNSGASYTHDYVELFNRGSKSVAIGGWSIQYGSAASDFTQKADLPTGASLPPGGYYLVQLAGGSNGTALPTPDHAASGTGAFNLSATAGKLALVRNTGMLACGSAANRCSAPVIEDLVGYGGASDYEGAAAAAPGSTTSSLLRKLNGCLDTNQNASDFLTGAASPRNSATPAHSCGAPADSGPKGDRPASDLRRDGSRSDALAPSGDLLRSDRRVDAGSPQASGGCACELGDAPSSGGLGGLLVLGLAALLLGRRRRRKA